MFLPYVNKGDDNDDDDDDDDDDEGAGGGEERNSRNSVYSHIYTKPYPQNEQKKNDISKQLSKQAIRQAKLREITKCLLTRFT